MKVSVWLFECNVVEDLVNPVNENGEVHYRIAGWPTGIITYSRLSSLTGIEGCKWI